MRTQEILGAVKGFIAEKIREYNEPSERKVFRAARKVEMLRNELQNAEMEAKACEADWMAFRKQCITDIKANRANIMRFRKKMETAGERIKAKLHDRIVDLERKNWTLERKLGNYQREVKDRWNEFKDVLRNDVQEIAGSLKGLTGSVMRIAR
ncbi:MAG TPA: hypothetical protein VI112_16410 [Bacteroidia bacterium]|jgi:hypothetical protein